MRPTILLCLIHVIIWCSSDNNNGIDLTTSPHDANLGTFLFCKLINNDVYEYTWIMIHVYVYVIIQVEVQTPATQLT
jgi:hypothetical protein